MHTRHALACFQRIGRLSVENYFKPYRYITKQLAKTEEIYSVRPGAHDDLMRLTTREQAKYQFVFPLKINWKNISGSRGTDYPALFAEIAIQP